MIGIVCVHEYIYIYVHVHVYPIEDSHQTSKWSSKMAWRLWGCQLWMTQPHKPLKNWHIWCSMNLSENGSMSKDVEKTIIPLYKLYVIFFSYVQYVTRLQTVSDKSIPLSACSKSFSPKRKTNNNELALNSTESLGQIGWSEILLTNGGHKNIIPRPSKTETQMNEQSLKWHEHHQNTHHVQHLDHLRTHITYPLTYLKA